MGGAKDESKNEANVEFLLRHTRCMVQNRKTSGVIDK